MFFSMIIYCIAVTLEFAPFGSEYALPILSSQTFNALIGRSFIPGFSNNNPNLFLKFPNIGNVISNFRELTRRCREYPTDRFYPLKATSL